MCVMCSCPILISNSRALAHTGSEPSSVTLGSTQRKGKCFESGCRVRTVVVGEDDLVHVHRDGQRFPAKPCRCPHSGSWLFSPPRSVEITHNRTSALTGMVLHSKVSSSTHCFVSEMCALGEDTGPCAYLGLIQDSIFRRSGMRIPCGNSLTSCFITVLSCPLRIAFPETAALSSLVRC